MDMSNLFEFRRLEPEEEKVPEPERIDRPSASGASGPGDSPGRPDSAPVTNPTPDEIAKADIQHMASGGSGSNPEAGSEVSATSVRQGPGRSAAKPREHSGGRRGDTDPNKEAIVRVPCNMAAAARDRLGIYARSRTEAVTAYLYMALNGEVDASDEVKMLASKIPVPENSELDIHRELESVYAEVRDLRNQLKAMTKLLQQPQSALVWLIGEKLGSPGARLAGGAQHFNVEFSDAELLRHRLAMQTVSREADAAKRRGREIEEAKFRKGNQ